MMNGVHWLYLAAAIVMEVIGTSFLKLSEGYTKLLPSLLTVVCYGLCFWLLALTLKKVEIGVAYAIWAGAGTALIAVLGLLFFKEPMTFWKGLSIGAIILGVVGLNLSRGGH